MVRLAALSLCLSLAWTPAFCSAGLYYSGQPFADLRALREGVGVSAARLSHLR